MTSRNEKRWILVFGLGLLGLTTLPYLLGYIVQGASWRFTGFVFGVEDGNSYIAKMLWGSTGAWLFRTPYTAFPQDGFMAFLPYLLLGKLTAPPAQHEQLAAWFQLFRWLGGMAMVGATYQFIAHFFEDVKLRRWGTAFIIAGGGLGWLSVLGFQNLWAKGLPLEFYSPETFGFLSFYGLPHLSLGRALLLWGLIGYLRAGESEKVGTRKPLFAGIVWLVMGLMQPLTIVTGWAVLAAHLTLYAGVGLLQRVRHGTVAWQKWRNYLKTAAVMVMTSSPVVLYTLISFSVDPFLREWSSQNLILSPPPVDYLWAFAIILPFVIIGLKPALRDLKPDFLLLIGWVVIFPILAYAPYNLQRRLPDGIWVALVILGLYGFAKIKSRIGQLASRLWLGSGYLPVFFVWLGSLAALLNPQAPLFRPVGEVNAFLYLRNHAPVDAVVLTDYESANALPAWAPVRTLIGHGPESMRLAHLNPLVDNFLANLLDGNQKEAIINEFEIDYLLLNPRINTVDAMAGLTEGRLKVVYESDGYIILEIQDRE